jgi:hypothetical protein
MKSAMEKFLPVHNPCLLYGKRAGTGQNIQYATALQGFPITRLALHFAFQSFNQFSRDDNTTGVTQNHVMHRPGVA